MDFANGHQAKSAFHPLRISAEGVISLRVQSQLPKLVIIGRKDKLWLRKRFCERSGLRLTATRQGYLRVGFAAYRVDLPEHLPKARAVQIARTMRTSRKLLKLGHVVSRLLAHADRDPQRRIHWFKARPEPND